MKDQIAILLTVNEAVALMAAGLGDPLSRNPGLLSTAIDKVAAEVWNASKGQVINVSATREDKI